MNLKEIIISSLTKEPKGAHKQAKKINFQDIANIINFKKNKKGDASLPKTTTEYINWAMEKKDKLEKKLNINLEQEIQIEEGDGGVNFFINNLSLSMKSELMEILSAPEFPVHIAFAYNIFECNEEDVSGLFINLHGFGSIMLRGNVFQNTTLFFKAISDDSNKNTIIINNKINAIQFPTNAPIFFQRGNEIEIISVIEGKEDNRFDIRWSPYQHINIGGYYATLNREFFIMLKEKAVEKNDKTQEHFINREILICDEHIIKEDERFIDSWQDRLIFWFGRWSSKHGISLMLPIWRMLFINALLTFSILLIAKYEEYDAINIWHFLHIWAEMLNPLSNLAETTGIKGNFIISLINSIQKGVLALFIYEAIRVGRRFVAK